MKNRFKNILERRAVSITMNSVMFMTSYFVVSFFWRKSAPDLTGLGRLTLCLVAASFITWMMTSLAKGGGAEAGSHHSYAWSACLHHNLSTQSVTE